MALLKLGVSCLLFVCSLTLVQGEETKDIACWRGEQCNSCNNGYEGSQNGVKVCCQQCYKTGFTLNGGDVCTCNMPPPTGSASLLSPHAGLLATLFLVSAVRAMC